MAQRNEAWLSRNEARLSKDEVGLSRNEAWLSMSDAFIEKFLGNFCFRPKSFIKNQSFIPKCFFN